MVMQSSGARSMAGSPAAATQPGPAADQTPESGPPRFGPTLEAVALSVVAFVVLLGLGLIPPQVNRNAQGIASFHLGDRGGNGACTGSN
jgi:hypothetical protein